MNDRTTRLIVGAACLVTAGCAARTAHFSSAEAIGPPAVVARRPGSPADRQLDALVPRDTAGLELSARPAWVDQLGALVQRTWAVWPDADALISVRAHGDFVYIDVADSSRPNRELGVHFSIDNPEQPYVSEPRYTETRPFAARGLDLGVPAVVAHAIAARFPDVMVTDVALGRAWSHEFELAWKLSVTDARGSLATVYADLDGTVLAVDPA